MPTRISMASPRHYCIVGFGQELFSVCSHQSFVDRNIDVRIYSSAGHQRLFGIECIESTVCVNQPVDYSCFSQNINWMWSRSFKFINHYFFIWTFSPFRVRFHFEFQLFYNLSSVRHPIKESLQKMTMKSKSSSM